MYLNYKFNWNKMYDNNFRTENICLLLSKYYFKIMFSIRVKKK